jgi:hypothetical protein
MKRIALFSLLLAAATGLGFAATTGAASRVAGSCGCTDCRCPNCNGVFCTCDVCECGNCACAAGKGTANAAGTLSDRAPSGDAVAEACCSVR